MLLPVAVTFALSFLVLLFYGMLALNARCWRNSLQRALISQAQNLIEADIIIFMSWEGRLSLKHLVSQCAACSSFDKFISGTATEYISQTDAAVV